MTSSADANAGTTGPRPCDSLAKAAVTQSPGARKTDTILPGYDFEKSYGKVRAIVRGPYGFIRWPIGGRLEMGQPPRFSVTPSLCQKVDVDALPRAIRGLLLPKIPIAIMWRVYHPLN